MSRRWCWGWYSIALLFAEPGAAWGRLGHQIVGDYAEQRLSAEARAEVERLLADEPRPGLGGVASWADEIRDGPQQRRETAPWHWVNFPRGQCRYDREQLCADGNCLPEVINRFAQELGDRSLADAQRAEALKFLVHFVGDAHQPLHAGFAEDRGGNRFQVNYIGKGWNLHALWDSLILTSAGLDAQTMVELAAGRLSTAPAQRDAAAWVEESCRIVQHPDFYPPRRKIGSSYLDAKRPIAERQLAKAGERLAVMLNGILGDSAEPD